MNSSHALVKFAVKPIFYTTWIKFVFSCMGIYHNWSQSIMSHDMVNNVHNLSSIAVTFTLDSVLIYRLVH